LKSGEQLRSSVNSSDDSSGVARGGGKNGHTSMNTDRGGHQQELKWCF